MPMTINCKYFNMLVNEWIICWILENSFSNNLQSSVQSNINVFHPQYYLIYTLHIIDLQLVFVLLNDLEPHFKHIWPCSTCRTLLPNGLNPCICWSVWQKVKMNPLQKRLIAICTNIATIKWMLYVDNKNNKVIFLLLLCMQAPCHK